MPCVALAGVLLAVQATAVTAQQTFQEANRLIESGRQTLRYAADLERNGDVNAAMNAYIDAAVDASGALAIGEALGVPVEDRPSGLYFLYGQAVLGVVQVRIARGGAAAQIDEELRLADEAFVDCLRAIDRQYRTESPAWIGRTSDAVFSLATVYFIRGDWPRARDALNEVLRRTPQHGAARETLAALNSLEGRGGRADTGVPLPPPPRGVSNARLMEYGVEIGKLLFGRWGTLAGMLFDDLFGGSR